MRVINTEKQRYEEREWLGCAWILPVLCFVSSPDLSIFFSFTLPTPSAETDHCTEQGGKGKQVIFRFMFLYRKKFPKARFQAELALFLMLS